MEESGRLRRGYFVAGLGATQFALPGALDLLRSLRDVPGRSEVRRPLRDRSREPSMAPRCTTPAPSDSCRRSGVSGAPLRGGFGAAARRAADRLVAPRAARKAGLTRTVGATVISSTARSSPISRAATGSCSSSFRTPSLAIPSRLCDRPRAHRARAKRRRLAARHADRRNRRRPALDPCACAVSARAVSSLSQGSGRRAGPAGPCDA